jgi:hypothetical protein
MSSYIGGIFCYVGSYVRHLSFWYYHGGISKIQKLTILNNYSIVILFLHTGTEYFVILEAPLDTYLHSFGTTTSTTEE